MYKLMQRIIELHDVADFWIKRGKDAGSKRLGLVCKAKALIAEDRLV